MKPSNQLKELFDQKFRIEDPESDNDQIDGIWNWITTVYTKVIQEEAQMETARAISESATSAGLAPQELTSDQDWKAEVNKLREEMVEEIGKWVKNNEWDIGEALVEIPGVKSSDLLKYLSTKK